MQNTVPGRQPTKRSHFPQARNLQLATCLLWLMFAQMAFGAQRASLTVDEPLHIISGYSYLKTGDARLAEEHPLFTKAIAALPLLLLPDLGDPRLAQGWKEGSLVTVTRDLLLPYPAPDRVAYAARVPVMWLGLLLAALVYRWASDLRGVGRKTGLLALLLCALDPNLVAHAQLATTDIGVTLFIFATFYTLWRWTRRPTRARLVTPGIMLGLALASKMSALLALPLIALIICITYARPQSDGWRGALKITSQALLSITGLFTIALLVVWATYKFELRWLPGIPFPIPAASHLIPLKRLFEHQAAGHSTFIWNHNSQMGWWYYFPLAFMLKTPLPTLILLAIAIIGLLISIVKSWRARPTGNNMAWAKQNIALLIFPCVYFASALFSTVDIGYRHLLPILPFIFVFIAAWMSDVGCRMSDSSPCHPVTLSPCHLVTLSPRLLISALFVWYIITAALVFPHPLAYFNELAGGPANGYHFLVDSNLDWGQDMKELKAYLDQHGVKRIALSAMMFLEPSVYGLEYDPLPPARKAPDQFPSRFNPEPGVYVISATSLQGVATPDINTYAFFRTLTPTARIGYSLFIYDILETRHGQWVAQCTPPPALLEEQDIASGFGRDDLQRVYFDCSQSWWYPSDGTPGWYVHPAAQSSLDETRWYASAQNVFAARTAEGKPYFDIVYVSQPKPPTDRITTAYIEPNEQINAPVATSGPLAFAGFWQDQAASIQPGKVTTIFTAWSVTSVPTQPVSIMAHLLAADGRAISVGDGLGVPIDVWQVGNTIVQAHRLDIPEDIAPGDYWIQTGVYRLDTLERYRFTQDNQISDKLLLTTINVKPK